MTLVVVLILSPGLAFAQAVIAGVVKEFGQINNLVTDSSNYGDWSQYFNGFDLTMSVRMGNGLNFQGGTSTGQTVADNCDVRENLPELNAGLGAGLAGSTVSVTSPYCHVAYGWLTQFRGLATYTIPKIDVQVSGVMQSKPGPLLAANWAAPAAVIHDPDRTHGQVQRRVYVLGVRRGRLQPAPTIV